MLFPAAAYTARRALTVPRQRGQLEQYPLIPLNGNLAYMGHCTEVVVVVVKRDERTQTTSHATAVFVFETLAPAVAIGNTQVLRERCPRDWSLARS